MIPQPNGDALLSLAECAELLGMDRSDLANRNSKGRFIDKAGDLGKRSPAFRRSEVLEWDRVRPRRARAGTRRVPGDAEGPELGAREPTPKLECPTLKSVEPPLEREREPEPRPEPTAPGDAEGPGSEFDAEGPDGRKPERELDGDALDESARALLTELAPALKRFRRAYVIAKDPPAYSRKNLALALRIAGAQLSGARSKSALEMLKKLEN